MIKTLGSGAFGQVWLAEAQGILALDARNKTSQASKRRHKIRRSMRYASFNPKRRKESQLLANGGEFSTEKTLVAVKTLKGMVIYSSRVAPSVSIRTDEMVYAITAKSSW